MDMFEEKYGKVSLQRPKESEELQEPRPEDAKILALVESGFDCHRERVSDFSVLYHLSHLRGNLTEWLPVRSEDTVLEFGADTGQLTGGLLKKAGQVVCLEESLARCRILARRYAHADNLQVFAGDPWQQLEGTYDWIIAPSVLADAVKYIAGAHPETEAVKRLLAHLKPEGHLVLAADNRFGLKYWAGALEPRTGNYFDSLMGKGPGRSRREIEQILKESGCKEEQIFFYYPYPELWFPTVIHSDERPAQAGELHSNLRNFEGERLVLFDEKLVYDQLIRDGQYPQTANAFLCVIGPEPEERIIYTKYSNDRAERFMIRTDIVKRAEGLEVRKVPLSKEAEEHVRALKEWEEILDRTYKKNHISANRCRLQGTAACFEYLKGRTFEEHLDELRSRKDYGTLLKELSGYQALLKSTLETEPFRKSREFTKMFGNPEFVRAYEGAKMNNLDWIFGNLMETEEGMQIIDYEWTFPVQVPVEYLLWRALSLYEYSREDVKALGLMAQMGITPEEERIFEAMEHHFQLWLLGGTKPIESHYMETAGRTLLLTELLAHIKKNRIQVYLDTGNGFLESGSFWLDGQEPDKYGVVHLELVLPEGTQAVRLDPMECTGLVKIKRLLGELGGTYPLNYTHNGRELEDQGILYSTTDPQITISGLVPGTGRIYAELTIQELHPDTAYACMNLLNRVRAAERLYESTPLRFLKKWKRIFRK